MKKFKYLVFCTMSFLMLGTAVNAEEPVDVDLENAYIIGTHIFTSDGANLTTQNIMLAAKTIESDNIEDMVIYFKPYGSDTWLSALENFEEVETPQGITEEGTIEKNYFTYIDLEPQEEAIEAQKKFELNSVFNIKTEEIVNDQYGQDIKFNQESISISSNGNVINVFENRGMKHWNNGAADEQWYGLLVDLGVNPANLSSDDYTIETVDYEEANRVGATSDTQFVLWLRGSDEVTTRVITFINEENGEAVSLTIKFNGITYFTYETDKDIVVNTTGVTYADGQFNVPSAITEIKFTEDGVAKTFVKNDDTWVLALTMNNVSNLTLPEFGADEPYKDEMTYNIPKVNVTNEGTTINVVENELLKAYNNGYANGEWFGFIVDLGVNPANLTSNSYTILPADITDAKRFGATSETAFIMWLTEEDFKDGNLEFTFNNDSDAITLTITFDGITGLDYEAKGEITDISNDVTFEDNTFVVGLDVTEFTFKDNGSLITAKKDTTWTFASNFEFVNASEIDTTNIVDSEPYYENIVNNQEAISVVVDGKVITVTKNKVLDYYTNGSGLQKEWYGLILDFGIDPTLLTVDGYTIEPIDITDAKRLGATSDTAFVVWLNGLDETRELVFRHKNNNDVTDTITVNVVTNYPTLILNGVTALDFTNIPDTEEYYDNMVYNNERVSFAVDGNKIIITELKPLIKYFNGYAEREWFGFLIDLGINSEYVSTTGGYGIEDIDKTDAERFGATSDTAFIIWLSQEDLTNDMTITFTNSNDVNDTLAITFTFDGVVGVEYEAKGEVTEISNDVTFEDNTFVVGLDVTEFTFKDNGKLVTANKVEDVWKFASEFNFVSASEISLDNLDDSEPYYENIVKNQEAIDVTFEGNVIFVIKNQSLVSYDNSVATKEWYGLIVDFGIDPTLLTVDGYTIEPIDITDAKRLGATTDTAFVVWLDGATETRELVFRHINDNDVIVTIAVNVERAYPLLTFNGVTGLDFTNIPAEEPYRDDMVYNNERVSFDVEGNVVTITELDPLKSYNNGYDNREWYGFLIDLGIGSEYVGTTGGYGIEDIDVTDAYRFGGTGDQFIIWLNGNNTDEIKTITFTNAKDASDTLTLTFKFVASHEATANTIEELNAYLIDSNITTINLGQDITDLTSRVVINRPVTINGNNHKLTFTNAINEVAYGERQGIAVISDDVVINDLTVEMDAVQDILSRLDENWDGVYAIQVYNSKNVILNNITATKADGGILVNASEVTLTGTITLSGNEFGGMEVSVGSSLPDATSVLNATEAIFVNETENFRQPTIWSIGDVSLNLDEVFNITTAIKEGETHYYLNGENIIAS